MAMLTEPNQPTVREQLGDVLVNIDAKGTPYTTSVTKEKGPGNTLDEWPVDAYDSAARSSIVDGVAVVAGDLENPAANRTKVQGRIHNYRKAVGVSKLSNLVSDVAGVGQGQEYAKGVAKKLVEAKRDIETILLDSSESAADDGATQGYETRGMGKWIQNGAQTDLPVPAAFRTPTASIYSSALTDLDESDVQAVLASVYGQTGRNMGYTLLCGTSLKQRFTDWLSMATPATGEVAVSRFNQDAASNKIELHVDVFEGDYGRVTLITDLYMPDVKFGYVLDMGLCSVAWNQQPVHEKLPRDGSGERGTIDAVFSHRVKNPLGLGAIKAS